MIQKKPQVSFEGIGLTPEQRLFVNSVVTGTGFTNPLEEKLRSIYSHVVRAIEQLEYTWSFWK